MKNVFFKYIDEYIELIKSGTVTEDDNQMLILLYTEEVNKRRDKFKKHNEKYQATRENWYKNKSGKAGGEKKSNVPIWTDHNLETKDRILSLLDKCNKTLVSKDTGLSRTTLHDLLLGKEFTENTFNILKGYFYAE